MRFVSRVDDTRTQRGSPILILVARRGDGTLWIDMGKRIVGAIAAIVVLLVCYLAFVPYRETRDDAADIRRDETSSPWPEPVATPAAPVTPAPSNGPHEVPQPPFPPLPPPSTDSIAPNPKDGFIYAGRGKFQVYRQGDLTWRLDTETGRTCILFATMEEWTKPIVYSNGCNKP